MMVKNPNESRNDDALTVLRTETALSRFPLHRLTNSQNVQIELKNQNGAIYWAIHHTTKFGQPGQLAYKIDTLIVNRRIEESGRPAPKIIRLGSLADIAHGLGSTSHNTKAIKQALLQNATASISAKISYRKQDGGEQYLEAVFNRYSVVFTGEKLPGGRTADAVYLVLNDIYQQILQTAVFRPLDYDYMKTLPHLAQRFYEIVSYQIYAALKHRNPRAKLLYSEYCAYSTAKRCFDFDHVKKQMYKVLRPHTQSGYIAKVEYEAFTNDKGETDWWMYYTPGINADREFKAFTGQGKTRKPGSKTPQTEALALPFPEFEQTAQGKEEGPKEEGRSNAQDGPQDGPNAQDGGEGDLPTITPEIAPETQKLIESLAAAELNRADAIRFAREKPEVCRRQLEYLPHVREFKTSRGAYLRSAIEGDFGPPAAYSQAQERQEADLKAKQRRTRELAEANQERARQGHEERFSGAYQDYLRQRQGEAQTAQAEAFTAFLKWEGEQRAVYLKPPFADRPLNKKALEVFDREASHLERFRDYFRERGAKVETFWEWDEAINDEPFRP